MLTVENLHVYYGAIHAIQGISFSVRQGEIVTLIGANGAGKSTILKTISGLLRPRGGKIILEGEEISTLAPHQIVARGISQVPEGRRVFPELSVMENLELGAYQRKGKEHMDELKRVFTLFPRLKERRNQRAGTLSGGEQQMLAIGRGLMAKPRLLLLDELPWVWPAFGEEIFSIIREINAAGTTILLVEQNAKMALSIAQTGYVLETGEIALSGPAGELTRNEEVRKAYLGL